MKTSFLTTKEAAEYLKISLSFLYKLTSAGRINHFKPSGKLLYFKQEDLDQWLLLGDLSETFKSR